MVFAVKLRWLPALSCAAERRSVDQFLRVFALPVMTLCCVIIAQMARMTRAAVIDQLRSPYVEMAVLKGARPIRVVLAHALPNAIGPIANAVALSLSHLLGGVIIVETIFNYPGIASLMVDARDDPRHAAGAGLRDDLLRGLSAAGHDRRHRRHPLQPEAAPPMSSRGDRCTARARAPEPRRRFRLRRSPACIGAGRSSSSGCSSR